MKRAQRPACVRRSASKSPETSGNERWTAIRIALWLAYFELGPRTICAGAPARPNSAQVCKKSGEQRATNSADVHGNPRHLTESCAEMRPHFEPYSAALHLPELN